MVRHELLGLAEGLCLTDFCMLSLTHTGSQCMVSEW